MVDVTAAVVVVHQRHGYAAGTVDMLHGRWTCLGPEAHQNLDLAPYEKRWLTIQSAAWIVDQQGALRRRPWNLTPAYLKQQLVLASIRWPALGKLYRLSMDAKRSIQRDQVRV